jgi:hypothetical protein
MSKRTDRKLSLNRETLRALSAQKLEEVVGGWPSWFCRTAACPPPTDPAIYCGPLR